MRDSDHWDAAEGTPLYQVVGEDGALLRADDAVDPELALRLYRAMATVRVVDERMVTLQRQGRISFYGAATGQEATVIGTGLALEPTDWVVPALREGGITLLRGMPLSTYVDQLFGNGTDVEKGRQMPCHYGHRDVRYVTLSSCIANQLQHAVGIALAARLQGETTVAAGYMGDGATSEGDFHVALEFAAQLRAPTLFVCQNNQWAISTGSRQQSRARTLASKAKGYGVRGYRVDGNDAVAVYRVTQAALQHIRQSGQPAFIEALTYRIGAHSTSDDPTRYRDERITEAWKLRDPLIRLRALLGRLGAWDDAADAALQAELTERLKAEVVRAESTAPPALATLFEDVWATPPWHLERQRAALEQHLSAHPGAAENH